MPKSFNIAVALIGSNLDHQSGPGAAATGADSRKWGKPRVPRTAPEARRPLLYEFAIGLQLNPEISVALRAAKPMKLRKNAASNQTLSN